MLHRNDAPCEEPAAETKTSGEKKPARYVDEHEAAHYIGMSVGWLRNSRMRGAKSDAPPFYKMGAAVRYFVTDLDGWLEERRHEPDEAA